VIVGAVTASNPSKPPFKTVLVANRGEIAIRICRAIHELGGKAVSIYSKEDSYAKHRRAGDTSFLLNPEGSGLSPVGAYLDIPTVIRAAKEMGAQAIHPGYGFLSENAAFAQVRRAERAGLRAGGCGAARADGGDETVRVWGGERRGGREGRLLGVWAMARGLDVVRCDVSEGQRQGAANGH
jgi:hypothetical protein